MGGNLLIIHRQLAVSKSPQTLSTVAKPKQPLNPFYVLSVIAGIAFTLTACGYGLLMIRANRGLPPTGDDAAAPHPLLALLDRSGMMILSVEVAVLAVVSIAAIMLDHYRGKRER